MKTLRVAVIISASMLILGGCGDHKVAASSAKPGSWAMSLGQSVWSMVTEQKPAAAAHKNEVIDSITLSAGKQTVKDIDIDSWAGTIKIEDKSLCFVKFNRGEEWGIVPGSGKLCDDADAAETMAAAKEWLKDMKVDAEVETSRTEAEFLLSFVPAIANTMVGNPDVDIEACMDDVSGVLGDLRSQVLDEECGKEYVGEAALAALGRNLMSQGLVNKDWSFKTGKDKKAPRVEAAKPAAADAPAAKGDSAADEPEKQESPHKATVESYVAWIKALPPAQARVIVVLDSSDTPCLKKWLFDNSAVQRIYAFDQADKVCSSNLPGGLGQDAGLRRAR